MSEAEFLKQVIAYAKLYGWRVAHFRPAKTQAGNWVTAVQGDGKGFPDLLLLRDREQVAAELKVGRNKTTQEQYDWLAAFTLAGVNAYVWYPKDWPEIERVLGAARSFERAGRVA